MSAAAQWSKVLMSHRMIQVARQTLRSKSEPQVYRDEAVQTLVRETDRLLDVLDAMAEEQQLVLIGQLLARRAA